MSIPDCIGLIVREMLEEGYRIGEVCEVARQVHDALSRSRNTPAPRRDKRREVISMEVAGYSRKAIAEATGLRRSTIKTYISEHRSLAEQQPAPQGQEDE